MSQVNVINDRKISAIAKIIDLANTRSPNNTARWLEDWSKPVDDKIAEYLGTIDTSPLDFNPYLVEEHVQAASRRLDVCLTRRHDIVDLLDRAFRFELDHSANAAANAAENVRDTNNQSVAQITATNDAAIAAQKEFRQSEETIAKGFAATAKGVENNSNEATRIAVQKILEGDIARTQADKSRIDVLYTFSRTPGHPLNYRQRTDRVFKLLKQDVAEAYQRLAALQEGLKLIWNESALTLPKREDYSELPAEETKNILDDLVMYARWATQRLEWHLSRESLVTYVFPLVQIFRRDASAREAGDALAPDFSSTFADEKGDTECAFFLKPEDFPAIRRPRVLAVGAAYTKVDAPQNAPAALCRVLIKLPQINAENEKYKESRERSILLSTVDRLAAGIVPQMSQSDVIRNINPCGNADGSGGAWKVKLLRGVPSAAVNEVTRTSLVQDLKIFITVIGKVGDGV